MRQYSDSPKHLFKLISLIIIIIFLVETLLMLVFEELDLQLSGFELALFDSSLLGLISSPIIYFLIIKPYVEMIAERERELCYIATHDNLTGLLNRRMLKTEFGAALEQCKRTNYYGALFFIDLNKFKPINDTFGHEAGDVVLCHVASKLEEVTRVNDLCARIGGDEFVLVLPLLAQDKLKLQEKALSVANKLAVAIGGGVSGYPQISDLSLSIGITFFPDTEHSMRDFDYFINKADQAMYTAKKSQQLYHIFNEKS